MRPQALLAPLLAAFAIALANRPAWAQPPDAAINPAGYVEPPSATDWSLKRPVQTAAPSPAAEDVAMIRQLARHRGGRPEALAQILQLSRELDDDVAAELVDELAAAHVGAGDMNLAAETRRVLAEHFPAQPRARDAMLWLVRLYASSEVAHARRAESPGVADLRRQLPATIAAGLKTAAPAERDGESTASAPPEENPLAVYALHLATHAMTADARLGDDAALAFQRSVAARRAGQDKSAAALLSPLKRRRAGDPWGEAARTEAWLQEPDRESPPRPTAACVFAAEPPHLDGQLNDPCWPLGAAVLLRSAASPEHAIGIGASNVFFAYDQEHLYIAVECAKAPGVEYPRDDRPRPHDGDVEGHDHVRLRLDLDRDYATWFELVVDSRGWTADRCWDDAAWNPQWFVAAAESADGAAWVIEAAIPCGELASESPQAGGAWACAIDRAAPKASPQSWAGPGGDGAGAESFGLLLFD